MRMAKKTREFVFVVQQNVSSNATLIEIQGRTNNTGNPN